MFSLWEGESSLLQAVLGRFCCSRTLCYCGGIAGFLLFVIFYCSLGLDSSKGFLWNGFDWLALHPPTHMLKVPKCHQSRIIFWKTWTPWLSQEPWQKKCSFSNDLVNETLFFPWYFILFSSPVWKHKKFQMLSCLKWSGSKIFPTVLYTHATFRHPSPSDKKTR